MLGSILGSPLYTDYVEAGGVSSFFPNLMPGTVSLGGPAHGILTQGSYCVNAHLRTANLKARTPSPALK